MELWDAYDRDGNLLGHTLVRGQPVPEGEYHLVAGALVRHADGTFLLMKRDPSKDNHPDVYEATAGGSALAGEDPLTAARHEVAEENGIARGTFTPLYTDRGSCQLYHGFLCDTDWPKDQITLQPGETAGYLWVTREELRAMIDMGPRVLVAQVGMRAWLYGAEAPVRLEGGLICGDPA